MNTRKCHVIKDYQAEFADPIAVAAGEAFVVNDKRSPWDDNPEWMWVWCTDQRGKSGWTPQNLIELSEDGRIGTARTDYDARELTVAAGQELTIELEESGWYWCCDQAGKHGWVPISHVVLGK